MPIEPLDTTVHDREGFRCGVDEVDRYLQTVARRAAEHFVSQTYVLVPASPRIERCEIFGYYTLVSHTYRDREMDAATARALKVKSLGSIPVILLGQFGVSTMHQRKGVGMALLRDALRRSLVVALSVGAVAVITDPIDERAAHFYTKHGFKPLPKQERRLLIPTAALARYNADIVAAFRECPKAL